MTKLNSIIGKVLTSTIVVLSLATAAAALKNGIEAQVRTAQLEQTFANIQVIAKEIKSTTANMQTILTK